jgi:hypothetical protein
MELAAHWHRCQNLPKKRVTTPRVYRERDDPVKDGLAMELFRLDRKSMWKARKRDTGGTD